MKLLRNSKVFIHAIQQARCLLLYAFVIELEIPIIFLHAQAFESQYNFESNSTDTQISGKNLQTLNTTKFVNFSELSNDISSMELANSDINTVLNEDNLDSLEYRVKSKHSTDNIDQRSNASEWWTAIERDINEMLLDTNDCPEWKYKCFYNESSNPSTPYQIRECGCDSSCNVYGECCLDKALITLPRSEVKPQHDIMYCGLLSKEFPSTGIFMIGECLEPMVGTAEDAFCHQKVPLESYEVVLDIPVLSLATNYVYRNFYCALCNDDADTLLKMTMSISCGGPEVSKKDLNFTIEDFALSTKYKPGEREYERQWKKDIGRTNNTGITSLSTNSTGTESYEMQLCKVKVKEYQDTGRLSNFFNLINCSPAQEACLGEQDTNRNCTKQIRRCNSSWPVSSDFEKCSSYSHKVFDEGQNILYKNPHCAKCNFANISSEQLYCPTSSFDFQTKFKSNRPNFAFPDLFKIRDWIPRKCEHPNDIWDMLSNRCREICGSGLVFVSGKCLESNGTEYNSTLKNNCLRAALDNFTIYENESVYSSVSDKLYTKGNYQIYNDSIILVCAEDSYYYKEVSSLHYYTTAIALSISIICLIFHIILYFCFARMRTWHGRNLLCLCCSLFVAQFLFLTGITATENFVFCMFMSVCLHYFWLASFCWMNILSIDVWRTFRGQISHGSMSKRKLFLYYSLYAWGVPFVITAAGLTLDLTDSPSRFRPRYADHTEFSLCWITSKLGLLCFFLIPIGVIIMENLMLFLVTSYRIYIQSRETHFAQCKSQSVRQVKNGEHSEHQRERNKTQEKLNKTNKIRFALYFKLGLLQGLTWLSGFLAAFINSSLCWYIFTILNGLQGAVIVCCFDIKKWVFLSVWEKIFNGPLASKFTKSTKSTSPDDMEANKKDQIDDVENANQQQLIDMKTKEKEVKILKGKNSLDSLKRHKQFVAKKLSLGSSVGFKSSQKPPDYLEASESEINSSENTNTGTTQLSEISDFLPNEGVRQPAVLAED